MTPVKKHILFVDDEQNILDGLRRMLRSMRSKYNMSFALGGEEALTLLTKQKFDVIISDMRMPGMSGAQLLDEVRKRYPSVIRLVLSGQADKDDILTSIGPIHQFLQKPCDEKVLKSTIDRMIEASNLLADEKLKSMVAELESLPSMPSHQQELLDRFQAPDVSVQLIGESISKDLAMSTKILQLVNSAFFGLRRRVSSPAEAVMLLGLDTVRSLVITMQVFAQVSEGTIKGFSQDSLLSHSVAVATIAKQIAQAEGLSTEEAEDAYLAGLLHDVGKLILSSKHSEAFAKSLELARSEQIAGDVAERRVIGATHSEIGVFLLGLWAFDTSIVEAALYHHDPAQHACCHFSLVTAVHVANEIVRASNDGKLGVDLEYLESIGLGGRLSVWQETCAKVA